MSTASQIEAKSPISTPETSDNLASEFLNIPACTIEDVDKALFNLFDKDLPLTYTHRNDTRRVPIVFATGERFAIIARKQPLRDRSKALILPVISIMRSGLTFGSEVGMATAPDIRHVIKKQLGKEDPLYQRLTNKLGLQNSDDLASPSSLIDIQNEQNAQPGRVATRRNGAGATNSEKIQTGNLLAPNIGENIYEIYEMPAPVYFMATYEITLWTQYTQEMNNLLAAIATENHFNAVTSYRIETDKGYYFVAYFDNSINMANNFDDFSEEERIVRSSLTVKVPGYFLGSPYKGAPNKIRRYVSAPQVSFENIIANQNNSSKRGIPSGRPKDYLLQDFLTTEDPAPGQQIGEVTPLINNDRARSDSDSNTQSIPSIGGYTPPASAVQSPSSIIISSPFSQNRSGQETISVAKTSTTKQGETTFRQIS